MNKADFTDQYREGLTEIRAGFPRLPLPDQMFMAEIDSIATKLDVFATLVDNYDVEVSTLRIQMEITQLLQHILNETDKPVSLEKEGSAEKIYYSTIRSNSIHLKARIEELKQLRSQLFVMENENIVSTMPLAAKILHNIMVPDDKRRLNVIEFLIEDILELLEIYEQIYQESLEFEAICKLIQSLPEEEKDKLRIA